MEYVYAAMLLHKAGQKVEEAAVTKVLEAAGVKVDAARVKALVAAPARGGRAAARVVSALRMRAAASV